MYVQCAASYRSEEKPSRTPLKIPFPGPETTLTATIGPVTDEETHPREKNASCSPLGPFYDFSITYTKAQRLTENRPDFTELDRRLVMDEAAARNSADIPV